MWNILLTPTEKSILKKKIKMPQQPKTRVFYFDLSIKKIRVEYSDIGATTEIAARSELFNSVKKLIKDPDEVFITKSQED